MNLYRTQKSDSGGAYILPIDNLTYFYGASNATNQLTKVSDITNRPEGFKDDSDGYNDIADDYTYDLNGNIKTDANKNITAIVYNHLNLPTKITFGTTGNITYIYNASGQKVQKQVFTSSQGSIPVVSYYLNGFQYIFRENYADYLTKLQFVTTSEGYYDFIKGKYVYNYTDHLGNIRLSYAKNPTTNVLEIIEESNYYPFGLKHSPSAVINGQPNYKYKYNGKELQDELGLNFYDYGARNYDPALGRWMNIDPLAEIYRRWSPYNYCVDNPIRFVDPDGMGIMDPIYGKTSMFSGYNLIGDDGKNDGKIHIVTDNSQSREIKKETEGGNKAIDLSNKDVVTLNGGASTVQGVTKSVEAEEKDTASGAVDAGLHEEGGKTEKDTNGNVTTQAWTPGAKKGGSQNASISPFGGVSMPSASGLLDYWHVHTSGEVTSGSDPVTGDPITYSAAAGPSPSDKSYQGGLNAKGYSATAIQVDTRGGKTVNFYSGTSVIFSMSYEQFKTLK